MSGVTRFFESPNGADVPVSYAKPMPVATSGTVSAVNSTEIALSGGGLFTGAAELNAGSDVLLSVKSDVDGVAYLDFSVDGTNWDSTASFVVTGGVNEFHTLVKGPRWCRARYQNGAAAQSYMRMGIYYGLFRAPNLPLSATVQQDADAATVRAVTEEVGIAGGLFAGYSIVNKFGTNSDVDTGSTPEDIWDGGGLYTGFPDSALETISVFSSSAADAAAGTGARTVRIVGLDANYDVQSETVTLNGVTPVATVNTFRRAHTATVQSAGSGGVNAGTLTFRHTTTTANVFLSMVVGRNQTNAAAYTVPAGYRAYMRSIHGAFRGSSNGTVDGYIWTRSFGGVFRSRRPYSFGAAYPLSDTIYGGLVFTEKSDIVLRISSVSANNTNVNGGFDLILVKN